MSPREHDPAVRDLFSAGDTLHEQLARLDRSEPPEELDRIVIERARQAIRMPQSGRPMRQFRWAVPLAVAATLLISFALVLHQVGPQPSETPPTAANSAPAPSAYDATEVDAPTSPPLAAVSQAAPSSAASRAAEGVESTARARVAPDAALANKAMEGNSATSASKAAGASDAVATVSSQAATGQRRAAGEAKADFRLDPDAWIAYIGRLRHVGRSEEADREYAQFRRTFPHYKYAAPARTPAEQPAEAIAPER